MAKGEVSSEMEKAVFWVQFRGMLFKSHISDLFWFKIFGNVIVTRVFFAL